MPILINYNVCDGAEGCPSVQICTSNALTYDQGAKKVIYDRERCWNCGTCVNYCGQIALYFAETDEELALIQEEMEKLG